MTISLSETEIIVGVKDYTIRQPFIDFDPNKIAEPIKNHLIKEEILSPLRISIKQALNYIDFLVPGFRFIFIINELPDESTLRHHCDLTAMLGSAKTIFLTAH